MAESYVTLSEAAELEGIKYKTMAQRLSRKKQAFETKTEKSETGGKDVVLVAVSSLSKQARNAWKEREKLKSFTEEFPGEQEAEQKPEVPWYVNTDVDWYIENYKERYYKAVELGNVVRKFLQYDEGDRTKYAEEFAQKHLGKGQRTLYDDFMQMEIQQRIRSKLSKREYIDAGSIQTVVKFDGHVYRIRVSFRRNDSNRSYNIDIESDGVEVIVE